MTATTINDRFERTLNFVVLYGSVRRERQGIKFARFLEKQIAKRGHTPVDRVGLAGRNHRLNVRFGSAADFRPLLGSCRCSWKRSRARRLSELCS